MLRWRWTPGDLLPQGSPETVVDRLPSGGHGARTFAFLGGDTLIVNIGSATNSCQREDRATRSPGEDPCVELETRADSLSDLESSWADMEKSPHHQEAMRSLERFVVSGTDCWSVYRVVDLFEAD